jgi:hypothetical protein
LPRGVEKRTYVFFPSLLTFPGTGSAKRAEIAEHLNSDHSNLNFGGKKKVPAPRMLGYNDIFLAISRHEGSADNDPQLDSRLMWTWFVPNPL